MKRKQAVLVKFKIGKKYGCFCMPFNEFFSLLIALGIPPVMKPDIWYSHQVGMMHFQYCIIDGYGFQSNSFKEYSEYLLIMYRNRHEVVVRLTNKPERIPLKCNLSALETYLWTDCKRCFMEYLEFYTRS